MPRYKFEALNLNGETVSGVEQAESSGAARLALVNRELQPFLVSEKASILRFEITKKRVPRTVIMQFSRQLAVFMAAGIPILEALEIILEETSDRTFKKALSDIVVALQAGDTFAAAASAHPEAFPKFFVGILESAELTGALDVVLNQLSDYLQRDADARSRVTSALVYPLVVLGMSAVTVVVLAVFVLPRFKTFFTSLNAKLPLPTRMLLSATNFFSSYYLEIIVGIILIAIIGIATWRSKQGRMRLDAIILKLPLFGDMVQHAILERICRILASMIAAGVSLPEAMTVTGEATNNFVYRRGLAAVREEMLQGQGFAGPLARSGLFPSAARQIFRVGEETGTLDVQLGIAAAFYDRELDTKIKRFTSLFEPAVIIIMGVVVGFVAVALVSAMYGIYKQVSVA
jgi:type IV pilus assembly protein PilC